MLSARGYSQTGEETRLGRMSASSSNLQLHVRARPLLAQVHHALQLVVSAEAPATLGGVVEGGRLRCQLTTSALAWSWGLAQSMTAGHQQKHLWLIREDSCKFPALACVFQCKFADMPLDCKDCSARRGSAKGALNGAPYGSRQPRISCWPHPPSQEPCALHTTEQGSLKPRIAIFKSTNQVRLCLCHT